MRAIYFQKQIPQALAVKTLRPLWPGVVWSPLSPTHVVDLPEPPLPGPQWLRVKNLQCGLCATDLALLLVKADPAIAPAALPGTDRLYLGHEVVSEVVEVGTGVTRFKVGDRVVMDRRFWGPNCYQQEIDPPCKFCAVGEYGYCENKSAGVGPRGVGGGWGDGYTCHETEVFLCPPDMTNDQAALIEPSAVALHGVLRRIPREGENVLIIGAGIIGLLTVQTVRAIAPGCRITVVAKYPHQAALAKRLGADEIIGRDDQYAEVARLTGGKVYTAPLNRGMILGGFEVIYDCIGSAQTVTDALRWARAGGAVILLGINMSFLNVDLNPLWYQEVSLLGSQGHGWDDWQGARRHTFDLVIDFIRAGKLQYADLITHRFPLRDYKQAVATAISKSSAKPIKVLFDLP